MIAAGWYRTIGRSEVCVLKTTKATMTQSMSAVSWGKGHKLLLVLSLENRDISPALNF